MYPIKFQRAKSLYISSVLNVTVIIFTFIQCEEVSFFFFFFQEKYSFFNYSQKPWVHFSKCCKGVFLQFWKFYYKMETCRGIFHDFGDHKMQINMFSRFRMRFFSFYWQWYQIMIDDIKIYMRKRCMCSCDDLGIGQAFNNWTAALLRACVFF